MADQDLVTVFVPDEPTELALVESVLREHDIPYVAKNEGLQNLFGAGQIGVYNLAVGPVALQVSGADLERSRKLIAETLSEEARELGEPGSGEADEEGSWEPSPVEAKILGYARSSLILGIFWFGGLGSLLAIYFGLKALALSPQAPYLPTGKAKFGLVIGLAGMGLWYFLWGNALLG